jgi:hypothetical protein
VEHKVTGARGWEDSGLEPAGASRPRRGPGGSDGSGAVGRRR